MPLPPAPRPTPRWAWGLAAVAVALFGLGLGNRLRCRLDGCRWTLVDRLLDLDGIDGLPRLFTTALFVAVLAVTTRAAVRSTGRVRLWWGVLAVIGALLAAAKLVSAHSTAKADAPVLTLVGGLALSAVALAGLWSAARRWGVPGGSAVCLALALYAVAALGLDVLSGLAALVPGTAGVALDAVATFVEELGEALTALLVLVAAWTWSPPLAVPAPAPG